MKDSFGEKVFGTFNTLLLLIMSFICLFPILNVLAISFSSSAAAAAGKVGLLPVGFTLASYENVLQKQEFYTSFGITVLRVIVGVAIGMAITIITAYPLSKEPREFPQRNLYMWFLIFTMLFSGGLIPIYMTIRALGLIDNFLVLILPAALAVWNVILLFNFLRALPKEVSESALVDGAGHWTTLWSILIPMSKPVLATLVLFTCVEHWNSWFDGLIYMSSPGHYPLQTYLQSAVVQIDLANIDLATEEQLEQLSTISNRTFRAAQIFVSTLPILLLYPFLQKYFIKGIVLGSVKE